MSLSMANDELERVVDFLERMENGAESRHALNLSQGERTAWREVKDEDDFHEAVSSLSGSTCTMPSAPASAKTVVTDGNSGKGKQAPSTESLSDVKKQEKRKLKAVPKVAAALPQQQQQQQQQQQKAQQKNDKKTSTAAPPVRARLAERKPAQPQAAKTDAATTDPAPSNAQQEQQQKGKGGWFSLF